MTSFAPRLLVVSMLSLLAGCMSYPSDPAGSNVDFRATLGGAGAANGSLVGQYSTQTRIFKWRMAVNGLSSPMTRGAIHGADMMDEDAALAPIDPPFSGNVQIGSVTLTPAQAADLMAGHWYVDLQTEKYPNGELRGALVPTSR